MRHLFVIALLAGLGSFVNAGDCAGVRRIQEAVFREDTTVVNPLGGERGIEEPFTATSLEPAAPLEIIEVYYTVWDQREYVYGPDYVDEFAFQIGMPGGTGDPPVHYMLQDANYNVVALAGTGPGSTAEIVEQYVYSPYGQVVAVDTFDPNAPHNRVGHQGLFFDRLGARNTDPTLVPGASGYYYNRNRWYSPHLGRFLQRDVNETALPIITALAFNGEALDALLGSFDAHALYADGMNLYAYLGGNPINALDALGLTYDDSWLAHWLGLRADSSVCGSSISTSDGRTA